MKYLLDANALVALGFLQHEFHSQVVHWLFENRPSLATGSITELGFVRVLSQAPQCGVSLHDAQMFLSRLKTGTAFEFSFISDNVDVANLPGWLRHPNQLTDAHLVHLAQASGAVLATLDRGVLGAFQILAS